MSKKKEFSRRKFLLRSAIGTGVMIGVGMLGCNPIRRTMADIANELESPYAGSQDDPTIWFEITADNEIVLHSPKVEMGQGTFTGMAQLAAEELEVDVRDIKVVHAASASGNLDQFATGGSTSIASLWIPLRELAATMREMLRNSAADLLKTDSAILLVANGIISGNGSSLTYGEIIQQTKEWKIPKTPALKTTTTYRYIGKDIPRVDLRDKVVGAPIFGMDAKLPNMLYGAVVRPSIVTAKYVSADTSEAEKMPGVVKIVREPDFVGVVATSRMEAENAKKAITVEWAIEKEWQNEEIEEMILVGKGKPVQIQKKGNASKILDGENIITAEYKSPIGAHAQLEPNGALAFVEKDKATVILPTQVVKITRNEVAKRIGLKKEQVNIQPTFLGGGFGRRLHTPNAIQAAVLSKAVGQPVKCFFNRKEEFQNDTFRPPTHHVLKAKLNEQGKIEAISHDLSSGDVAYGSAILPDFLPHLMGADVGAWRGGMIQYEAIPNFSATSWRVKLPFATSWWRSLGLLANTFAIESFMDELAIEAGKDPVQFRLDQIQNDDRGYRLKEVIKAAAKKVNWKDGVHNGRAMGFAASTDVNTPCAQVAEVSVENNQIKIHKVTCAIDPGIAVNPDQIRAQCEGAIIMGISGTLFEKMIVRNGSLQPTIYGPYQMVMMRNAPKEIDVVILENDDKPGAVGEPPLGPIGAAIANAVFRLTGQRLREMPLALGGK
ncbi:MAG: molybdopterin cofactor-binding domain-containing protein [Bacteroidota bacterium]